MEENINKGRRSFTIGATIGLGAVCSGFFTPFELFSQIKEFDKEKNAFLLEPNVFLQINSDNTITITIPRCELGQGVRTSLAMLIAEELDADWSKIKAVNAPADSKYGSQTTSGSTSISDCWETLRYSGAQARALFISAAAQIWETTENNCRTENSFVYEISGNRSLSYGELVDVASTLPIPSLMDITVKDPSEFKIIGKTKWHIDNPDIFTGKAIYGSDFRYEGMKYAVVIRPPEIGGSLKSFDDSEAKSVKGFIGTYENSGGIAVVADSTYIALKASYLITAEWNPGPISNISSDIITEEMKSLIGTLPELPATTKKQIEAVYEVPFLAHSPMEPVNSFANFQNDKCEVWTITQNPRMARTLVASAVGLPDNSVALNVLMAGGAFGRGNDNDYVQMVARISKLSGYPIKLFFTKSDDIKNDYYRPCSIHAYKAGIDENGQVTGLIKKDVAQSFLSVGMHYNVPVIHTPSATKNYSIPEGYWRSVDFSNCIFANDCFIDELAELANRDPLEFRLEISYYERQRNVLQLVAEKAEWNKELPKNWGRGIASCHYFGSFAAHIVEVSVSELGTLKVERIVAAVDCGIVVNPGNVESQIMGAAIDALSTAIKSDITIKDGKIEQSGFHNFEWLSMRESPKIEVYIVPSAEMPSGVGELGFPSVSPALCNAIYNACGVRVRRLPIKHTSLISGIKDNNENNNSLLKVFPNPFVNFVNIEFDFKNKSTEKVDIAVFDILGNKVFSGKKEYFGELITERLSLNGLNSGCYSLVIQKGKEKHIFKIVK